MTRTTKSDIEMMRKRGLRAATIAEAELRLERQDEADKIITIIEHAFDGVVLGNGIGLWQAQGLDDYEDEETCQKLRLKDETQDWRKLTAKNLNRCYSSLYFFDAEGYRFHLPAFLCAELRGEFHQDGIVFSLTGLKNRRYGQLKLLSPLQRSAIRAFLIHERDNPFDDSDRKDIEGALSKYWREETCREMTDGSAEQDVSGND